MNIFIANINGNEAELTADESWHCAKVLRYRTGQKIKLIDGKGAFYEAVLELVNEKKCLAHIQSAAVFQKPSPYYLHLAIAPTKNIDRIEWMLEKAVEIGINEISLFTSQNSERTVVKEERLRTIIESAVKQSLQARIPKLNPIQSFDALLKVVAADQKYIAHCNEGEKKSIKSINFNGKNTAILVGPEGDFSNEEVNRATLAGFSGVSLGENRLRTETAGLYICQTASILS